MTLRTLGTNAAALKASFDTSYRHLTADYTLPKLRVGLAKAVTKTGVTRWGFVGDSKTSGLFAGTAKAWPLVMRDLLAARGIPTAGEFAFTNNNNGGGFDDPRWTRGGWTPAAITAQHGIYSNTNGQTATFTSTVTGTVAELLYYKASGAMTVSIDGGTGVSLPTDGFGATGASDTLVVYTVTGLANTTHTIAVTRGNTGDTFIFGAGVRQTTGLVIDNGGISGSTSNTWNTTSNYGPAAAIAKMAPDVVFINLGTNDITAAVSAATYRTRLESMIARSFSTAGIVLCVSGPTQAGDNTAYQAQLYDMAATSGYALLDFKRREVSYAANTALGFMYDNWHENANGHADLGWAAATELF